MAHYRTFPIGNLTSGPRFGFFRPAFRVFFLSYFVFPFKIKTKISGDSKPFFKNGFF